MHFLPAHKEHQGHFPYELYLWQNSRKHPTFEAGIVSGWQGLLPEVAVLPNSFLS